MRKVIFGMNVLIDTSIWVDHFKNRNHGLIELLETDRALTRPMILAELSCGTPPQPRSQMLNDIGLLQMTNQASLDEVMNFIESEKLYGPGCGIVDIVLLASTLITPSTKLWTLDKRLSDLAEHFGAQFQIFSR